MLHRDHSKHSYETSSSLTNSIGDAVINLPDLSAFQDAEKKHILDVLIRNEDLRNNHLSRFLNLRKEVNELEQHSQNPSTAVCARCQTPFGYIFNTGDACPKCAAKVCKQCRLLYNLNENGWLCLLCSKQMQLMSYSGEWVYTLHSNLRKKSEASSSNLEQADLPTVSIQNIRSYSSSESESDEVFSPINKTFPAKLDSPSSLKKNQIQKLIVQRSTDEDKFKFIKRCVEERPVKENLAERLAKRGHDVQFNPRRINANSLSKLPTKEKETESTVNDEDGEKKLQVKPLSQSSTRGSKLSLASTITTKTSRKHLSASMQSLRDVVSRISHPQHSSSRVSLNSEKNNGNQLFSSLNGVDEDQLSLRVPGVSSPTNSRHTLQTPQSSFDDTKRSRLQSANSTESEAILQRNITVAESDLPLEVPSKRESTAESEDDIDGKFRKARLNIINGASSLKDIRGSQISINSTMSDANGRYEMDISGAIQLKLSYNIDIGGLNIFVAGCTNLASNKRQQSINPYCKFYLLPDKSKNSKRKTAVKKSTTQPVFNETFRYYLGINEFDSRTLSVSVWSQSTITQNDFLGEIQIPLAHCTLDQLEDYPLSSRTQDESLPINLEATNETNEVQFELSFIEHYKNREIGTIQVNHIHGQNLFSGKTNLELFCKGLLLPNKLKRKIPVVCKGSSPKWDVPLRWENIRRESLKTLSLEITIWNQERFRKTLLGFIRLNSLQKHRNLEALKLFHTTPAERTVWETFSQSPTRVQHVRLPLRSVSNDKK